MDKEERLKQLYEDWKESRGNIITIQEAIRAAYEAGSETASQQYYTLDLSLTGEIVGVIGDKPGVIYARCIGDFFRVTCVAGNTEQAISLAKHELQKHLESEVRHLEEKQAHLKGVIQAISG